MANNGINITVGIDTDDKSINAAKKEFSAALFASVFNFGDAAYYGASVSLGVRPEIWLVK